MRPFRREPHCIEPGDWPERTDRPRVLIENPDHAALWAHEEILREAGYDVAACSGPTAEGTHVPWFGRGSLQLAGSEPDTESKRQVCPLIAGERCPLVDGADVVVTSTGLVDIRSIIEVHRARGGALVVEGTLGDAETERITVVEEPVTQQRLVDAVARALDAK